MSLWLSLALTINITDQENKVFSLLEQCLDPCNVFEDGSISQNNFMVGIESVISHTNWIYNS